MTVKWRGRSLLYIDEDYDSNHLVCKKKRCVEVELKKLLIKL